jgi:hypothetical protein
MCRESPVILSNLISLGIIPDLNGNEKEEKVLSLVSVAIILASLVRLSVVFKDNICPPFLKTCFYLVLLEDSLI